MSWIFTVFDLVAKLFGYQTARSALRNTKEMQERAKLQAEEDRKAKMTKIVADQDLEKTREMLRD